MRYICFILFISCANFSGKKLSHNLEKESSKICLSSGGSGRLTVLKKTYVFSYESLLDNEHGKWILAMSFPLRNPETFELDWSEGGKVKFESSIEDKVLRENKNINPNSLYRFTQGLGTFFEEIVSIKSGKKIINPSYNWEIKGKTISSINNDKSIKALFDNLIGNNYFGLMSIKYDDLERQSYQLDLVVRNCLK